jgi:hypothetical protein
MTTTGRKPRRTLLLLAFCIAALAAASVAAAYTTFYYHGPDPVPPGGGYNSPGYATREWNRACRTDNSGIMSVSMWHPDGYNAAFSGEQWTNCIQGVWVRIDLTGVFKTICTNGGSVSFTVTCQSTRP